MLVLSRNHGFLVVVLFLLILWCTILRWSYCISKAGGGCAFLSLNHSRYAFYCCRSCWIHSFHWWRRVDANILLERNGKEELHRGHPPSPAQFMKVSIARFQFAIQTFQAQYYGYSNSGLVLLVLPPHSASSAQPVCSRYCFLNHLCLPFPVLSEDASKICLVQNKPH